MKKTIPWALTWFMALMLVFSVNSWGQTVITQWDFNGITAGDVSTAIPSEGSGVLTLIGGTTHPATGDSGSGSSDPVSSGNKAFQTTTYPAQGLNSATAGIQLAVSTAGFEDISLSFDLRLSNTASRWIQVWYTLNGTDYVALGDPFRLGGDADVSVGDTWTNGITADFSSITGANDNPDFGVRIVTAFSAVAFTEHLSGTEYEANAAYEAARNVSAGSQSNYAGGTVRFDMITFSGEEILEEPEPFTTLFQFSNVDANLPTWFGSQLARGFAVYENNLYLANRNATPGQQVQILNRLTGEITGFLNTTGIDGGTFPLNDVEVSADGVVLLSNLAQSTGGIFTIYKLDATLPVEVLISLSLADVGAARLGDKFSVVGSFADGSARIYAADASTPRIFRWTMNTNPDKDGFVFGEPDVIPLVAALLGSNPSVASLPNGQMYYTAGGTNVYKLNADGSILGMVPGGIVATGSSALKYFGTDGNDEILAVFLYGPGNEKVRFLRIPNGVAANAVIEFDTPVLGTVNSTGNADVTFVPSVDGQNADFYVLSATNGLGGYYTNNLDITFPVYLPFEDPSYTVTFTVADEDGVAITDAVITFDGVENAAGVYVFEDLEAGDYPYTVAAEGFLDATGTVSVVDQDVAVAVVLQPVPPTYTVTFVVEDEEGDAIANAVVTLNGVANAAGNYVFADVLAGTYAYTVVADGFEDAAGNVVVVDQDVTVTVEMAELAAFVISEFPWLESFEDDSETRPEWSQIQEAGAANWTFVNGAGGGAITSAYQGTRNARFVSQSGTNTPRTKLVTPLLDLSEMEAPRVSFWYGQEVWFGDQNQTKVFYRVSPQDAWVEIAHFTGNVSAWRNEVILLPEASATYQLAFEGINNYGRANVLDNVLVEESPNTFALTFAVEDENGLSVDDAIVSLNGVANAAGDYAFEVEPGTYSYAVAKTGYQTTTGSVTVVDEAVNVEVVINQLFTISFVVEDIDEQAIEGAQIVITDEDQNVLNTLSTNAQGEAEVILIAGDYFYSISRIGFSAIENIAFAVSADAVIEITLLVAPPIFTIAPEAKNFGQVLIDAESAPQVFVITNIGGGILTITDVELPSADDQFALIDTNDYAEGIDLETGETLTFSVVFAPTSEGIQTGTITVSFNDGADKTFDVSVVGEGFDPVIAVFPYEQTFDPQGMPVAWSVEANSGSSVTWQFPGSFAVVNSDAAGSGNNVHSTLYSPFFDVSELENPRFRVNHFYRHLGAAAYGRVKISIDESEEWITLANFTSNQGSGTLTAPVFVNVIAPLTEIMSGGTTFQLAFEYNDGGSWAWYWLVNNFVVEETPKHIVSFSVEGGNGAITAQVDEVDIVSGDEVLEGKNVIFAAVPDLGYRVLQWTVNGQVVANYTAETYALNNITEPKTVTVEFEEIPTYEVVFSAIGEGELLASVEGEDINSGDMIFEGSNVVFTAVPDDGYRVLEWTVDGEVVEGFKGLTWTLEDLMDDVAVTVEFEEIPPFYAVTFTVTDFDLAPLVGANVVISGLLDVELVTDENGVASVELEDGDYMYVVSLEGYATETDDFVVDGAELDFDLMLEDVVTTPYGLVVDVDGKDALFRWNVGMTEEFFEGFEGAFPPAGWAKLNPDGGTGWIALNAGTTPLPGWQGGVATAAPDGGARMAYASWMQGGATANDQWLVTPQLIVTSEWDFSFLMRYWPDAFVDNVEIRISTTVQNDPAAFNVIVDQLTFSTGSSTNWEVYSYNLSDFVAIGTPVYVAIREYVPDNDAQGAAIMLDNFHYGPEIVRTAAKPMASVGVHKLTERNADNIFVPAQNKAFLGYNVFLNGDEVASNVAGTEYQFTDLPYGTHVAGVQAVYSSFISEIITKEFVILPEPVEPLVLNTIFDKTGTNVPAVIADGGLNRGAALYLDRYVIVPFVSGGEPNVWAWDMLSPHLDPIALSTTDISFGFNVVNYAHVVGEDIYVSNMTLGSNAAHPFRVYRWTGLDAEPEIVLSTDGGWGRLGDAFSIIGDPSATGSIIGHLNSGGDGQRVFKKWNFVDGVLQNLETPETISIEGTFNMNSFGVLNPVEGEDGMFLTTGNGMGIALVDISGVVHGYIGSDIVSIRTLDPRVFTFNGNRYLAYGVNNVADTQEGARYEIIDISFASSTAEAMSVIQSVEVLENLRVASYVLGSGSGTFPAIINATKTAQDELMFMAFATNRGFIVETTGTLPATYALTVEAQPAAGGTVTGGGDYFEGATVPVTATPASGYQFVNWTVGANEVSTAASFNFTMPGAATTLVANFETIPVVDVATLAELRTKPADGTLYRYTGNAVIVAQDGFRNRKFLQDATAAIQIDDQPGVITTPYDLYDEITNVVGRINIFNNMVRFQPQADTDPSTQNTPVDPTIFAIDELTSADQAKLIKLVNVTFQNLTEDQVFANGTNYVISDGENEMTLRTDFWNVDYIGEEIPDHALNITGVMIQFQDGFQIVPRFAADFEDYVETFAVTFNVDMTPATGFDPASDVVYMTGSMFGWATPGDQPENQTMTRVDQTMIWTKTLQLEAGTYQYKYFMNAGWDGGEWDGAPDRVVVVDGAMVVNNVWRDLVNVNNFDPLVLNLFPNPARDIFNIHAEAMIRNVVIADLTGKIVYSDVINDTQTQIRNTFEAGMYIVRIYTDEGVFVRKLQIR